MDGRVCFYTAVYGARGVFAVIVNAAAGCELRPDETALATPERAADAFAEGRGVCGGGWRGGTFAPGGFGAVGVGFCGCG